MKKKLFYFYTLMIKRQIYNVLIRKVKKVSYLSTCRHKVDDTVIVK